MSVVTINAGHSVTHNFFMHRYSQTLFVMTFVTYIIPVKLKQRAIFRRVRQMTGRAVTNCDRAMHKGFTNIIPKIAMTDKAEFTRRPDKADCSTEIVTILTFFLGIGKMFRDMQKPG